MSFQNNKMVYLHVLFAVLAIGDCSLGPWVRPILSLLEGPTGMSSPLTASTGVKPTRYRFKGPPVTTASNSRWGGFRIDSTPVGVGPIVEKLTPLDGANPTMKLPIPKVPPIYDVEENEMYKYITVPHTEELMDNQIGGWKQRPKVSILSNKIHRIKEVSDGINDENSVSEIRVKPVETGGYKRVNLMMNDYSEDKDLLSNRVQIISPQKGGYRDMKRTLAIYGGLSEEGRSSELGLNKVGVLPIKQVRYTVPKETLLINSDLEDDGAWVKSSVPMVPKQRLLINSDLEEDGAWVKRSVPKKRLMINSDLEEDGAWVTSSVPKKRLLINSDLEEDGAWVTSSVPKKRLLINSDLEQDGAWVKSSSELDIGGKSISGDLSDIGDKNGQIMYLRKSWIDRGGSDDPGHDSDDQPDHDRLGQNTFKIKTTRPEVSDEQLQRVVFVTKPVNPLNMKWPVIEGWPIIETSYEVVLSVPRTNKKPVYRARYHTVLRANNASRKRVFRRRGLQPKMAARSAATYKSRSCIFCPQE